MQVKDLINNNFSTIATLAKVGLLPCNVISDFEIYEFFRRLDKNKPKMVRYSITSEAKGVGEDKVRKVVREMEKKI